MKPEDLRPLEALYLLSRQKQREEWNFGNALTAVMIDLCVRGFLIAGKKSFSLSDKGLRATSGHLGGLRDYEMEILCAVDDSDYPNLMAAIEDINLKQYLLQQGLMDKIWAWFLFVPYKKKVVNEKGFSLIQQLIIEKEFLLNNFSEKPNDLAILSRLTIFPSLWNEEKFIKITAKSHASLNAIVCTRVLLSNAAQYYAPIRNAVSQDQINW